MNRKHCWVTNLPVMIHVLLKTTICIAMIRHSMLHRLQFCRVSQSAEAEDRQDLRMTHRCRRCRCRRRRRRRRRRLEPLFTCACVPLSQRHRQDRRPFAAHGGHVHSFKPMGKQASAVLRNGHDGNFSCMQGESMRINCLLHKYDTDARGASITTHVKRKQPACECKAHIYITGAFGKAQCELIKLAVFGVACVGEQSFA